MSKLHQIILTVLLGVTCLLIFLGNRSISSAKSKVLKIGALFCLSGDCAEWGTNSRRGVELAVEKLNAQGGLLGQKIEVQFEDSRDDVPSRTVSAFHSLSMNQDIHLMQP